MRHLTLLALAIVLVLSSGCAAIKAKPDANAQLAIDAIHLAANTLCGKLLTKNPDVLAKAKASTAAAETLLSQQADYQTVIAAFEQGLPPADANTATDAVKLVNDYLKTQTSIDPGSNGYLAVQALVDGCAVGLT